MPSDSPPSYQAAVGQPGQPGGPGRGPALKVTTPQGETRTASQDALGDTGTTRRPGHSRSASDVSDISDVESDGGVSPGLLDEEGRRSMDDEQRELPEGWVRCWDPKWVSPTPPQLYLLKIMPSRVSLKQTSLMICI